MDIITEPDFFRKKKAPSLILSVLLRQISARFAVEIHPDVCKTDNHRIIHISYYESMVNLEIASSLLNPVPAHIMGYSESALSTLWRLISLFAGKGEKDKINAGILPENFCGSLSLTSKKLFKKRYIYSAKDPIQSFIDAKNRDGKKIYLVPHLLFWNRNPERMGGFETLSNKSSITAAITVLKSATLPLMKILQPVDLDLFDNADDARAELMRIYEEEKKIVLGPILHSHHEIERKILYHQSVADAVKSISLQNASDEVALRKKAYTYFNEIAADFSIVYVKYFSAALGKIYKKIYDKIEYSREDILSAMEKAKGATPVFITSHKSLMDFLLVSSIFYNEGVIPPHIVAGLNMNFFPMGKIFRKSGGFFMRRSFRNNPLYAAVFRRYVMFLVQEQYSLEFFIEGGRSRSGRLLKPKIGIFKYISEAVEEDSSKRLVFIPISINYDKIFEENTYVSEIRGKEKKAESAAEFVKTRKLLRKKHGRVYMTFGEPMEYSELMKKNNGSLAKAADEIADKINQGMKVSINAFLSLGILAEEGTGFSFSDFSSKMGLIYDYMLCEKIPCGEIFNKGIDINKIILTGLRNLQGNALLAEDESDRDNPFFIKSGTIRQQLFYYRNTIAHHFLPLSCTAAALLSAAGNSRIASYGSINMDISKIIELISFEFTGFTCSRECAAKSIEFLEERGLVYHNGMDLVIKPEAAENLKFMARIIQDIIESGLIVMTTCIRAGGSRMTEHDLMTEIRRNGVQFYHKGIIKQDESLSQMQYKNFIAFYKDRGIIQSNGMHGKKEILFISGSDDLRKDLDFAGLILSGIKADQHESIAALKKII